MGLQHRGTKQDDLAHVNDEVFPKSQIAVLAKRLPIIMKIVTDVSATKAIST